MDQWHWTKPVLVVSLIILLSVSHCHVSAQNGTDTLEKDACGGCKNGGYCDERIPTCLCTDGYQGIKCERRVTMKTPTLFNCRLDGGCEHEGICIENGECLCIRPYYGKRCQFLDDWWNASMENDKDKRSMIVSASFAILVMFIICFLILYVNIKRVKEARADANEIRNAVQVDGPPRMRVPGNEDRETRARSGSTYRPSWYLPFERSAGRRISHSREGNRGLHPVSTAPAILQGTIPPKYHDVATVEDCDRRASVVTVHDGNLMQIPPSYDEALLDQEKQEDFNSELYHYQRNPSVSSGIFMRSIPSESENVELMNEQNSRRYSRRHCSGQFMRTSPRIDEESDENDSVFEYVDRDRADVNTNS
ncbi:uncharacterized protein [Ptychodera flava]|uniref:uncharacterized protein n=1 Tax=Ptychodera flava TaxID=63121 RepID=UPI00396A89B3